MITRESALLEPQPTVEARVLAEVICSVPSLRLADRLETRDFQVASHRVAFEALRNVQARGEQVCVSAIFDEIEADAAEKGMPEDRLFSILFDITKAMRSREYGSTYPHVFMADLRHLRKIADARRAAMEAA